MSSLMLEAVIVGAVLAVALAITVKFTTIQTSKRALVAGFVLGVLIHLGFEFVGANKAYCTVGVACAGM